VWNSQYRKTSGARGAGYYHFDRWQEVRKGAGHDATALRTGRVLSSEDHRSEVWTSVELLPRIAAKMDSLERDASMLPVAIVRSEPDLSRNLGRERRTVPANL